MLVQLGTGCILDEDWAALRMDAAGALFVVYASCSVALGGMLVAARSATKMARRERRAPAGDDLVETPR